MRNRVHSLIEMHANSIVVLDWIVEETFHQAVRAERLFYFALHSYKYTRRPSLVLISTGLKYFTSPGLKNIYLTVALLLFIL